eukprot:gene12361-biopygen9857
MIRFGSNHMEWNLDEMLAALGKEVEVLEGHVPIFQHGHGQSGQSGGRRSDQQLRPKLLEPKPATASALFTGNEGKSKCAFCLGEHKSESCESYKNAEERKKILIKYGRCFSCLKPGHRSFKCTSKVSCKSCKQGNHHFSICPGSNPSKEAQPKPIAPQLDPQATSWVGNTGSEGRVALQTALAVVDGKSDRMVRVLFDTGSHKTFITSKAVSKLELKPVRKERLGIKAFGSEEMEVAMRDVIKMSLSGKEGKKNVEIEAYVVKDISSIPNIHIETVKKDFAHLNKVWFADVSRCSSMLEIDCLIGSDFLWAFQEDETIRGGPGEPVAVKTSLGWVLSGPLKGKTLSASINACNVNFVTQAASQKEIDSNLHKLWDLDSLGIREGDPIHETVLDDITFNGTHYSVGLPWKVGHKSLPSNYNISQIRLNNQARKLKENPEVLKQYDEIISEQASEGIIEQVSELESVNDLVTSCKDTQSAHDLYVKSKDRMKAGGFTLRKWKTNDSILAGKIGQGETRVVAVNEDYSYVKETLGIADSTNGRTKVLGLTWDNQKDLIEFELCKIGKEINNMHCTTKRGILSILASLFDPLGLTSPVAVTAKIIFQELCLEKLNWDDPLPKDKCLRWEAWLRDLLDTKSILVNRCIINTNAEDIISCELHGFADASQKAYCGMVFLVYKTSSGIHTSLVSAKTRVAPLKKLTIPRLELMSARVVATLMNTVLDAIGTEVRIDQVKYWLDSKTALYWIYNNGEWKQFVQHRVNEILRLSKKEDWGHVAGIENPADLGSRGVTASYLKSSKLWWEGPEWLKKGQDYWPDKFCPDDSLEVEDERKETNVMLTVEQEEVGLSKVVKIERYGSLMKLLRVTALVMRFVENLKRKKAGDQCIMSSIRVEEIEAAEKAWIVEVQNNMRQNASFQKTSQQLGIQNEKGILVCKGRLSQSDLDFRSKYPMILPKNNSFTDLVIFDCHVRVHHNKLRSTLTELRSRFWVPQGRQQVKKVINRCQVCKRLEAKAFQSPPVADLPSFRVTENKPFSNVGIDFAGPLWRKEYLVDLREFHKIKDNNPSKIGKGDLVLLYEDNVKRALWKVGIVEDLITGKDGQCRGAVVRKSGKGKSERLTRPLQKLFPLEISSKENEVNTEAKEVTRNEETNEKGESGENEREERNVESVGGRLAGNRPVRAAAKDARWKSQLMLDP